MTTTRFTDLIAANQVAGKRVFIRVDFNVPQDDTGRITDDTRISASLPCIEAALKAGASVMVTSHLGRPKEGHWTAEDSLAPIAARVSELLGRPVPLVADWVDGVTVNMPANGHVEGRVRLLGGLWDQDLLDAANSGRAGPDGANQPPALAIDGALGFRGQCACCEQRGGEGFVVGRIGRPERQIGRAHV